jgi:hypothetical protein
MTYQTYFVAHGSDGFKLYITRNSRFADTLVSIVDFVDEKLTRHRLCTRTGILNAIYEFSDKHSKTLHVLRIDRETADLISRPMDDGSSAWSFLDDEDEEELEVTERGA